MATIYLLIFGALASKIVGELYDGVKPVTALKQKFTKVVKTKEPETTHIHLVEECNFRKCGNGYTIKL